MPRPFTKMFWPHLLVLGLAGCQGGCGCDPTEATFGSSCEDPSKDKAALVLEVVAGDNQSAQVATQVTQPLLVHLRDATFADVPDVEIDVTVKTGGGLLAGPSQAIVTDGSGRATIPAWTLGPAVGPNTVEASVKRSDPDFSSGGKYYDKYDISQSNNRLIDTLTATGTAGPPNKMAVAATPTQGVAGQAVTPAPAVKITDAHDNPLAGIGVSFVALDGGSVSGGVPVTDAAGVATVGGWTLGGSAIAQHLVATASATGINGSPLDFVVQAVAGAAAKVTATTPVAIGLQPSAAVSPSPTVKVVDQHDNPIAGLAVTFAVGSTGGVVTGASQTTNVQGLATVSGWTVGSTDKVDYTLVATVAGNGITNNPVTFTAHTSSALSLAISAGNNQSAIVSATVAIDPQVRVTDGTGAGVPGVVINWGLVQGSGSFLPLVSTTDAQGYATLDYFGPTVVGPVKLRARTTDARVQPQSVDFTITGTPEP